MKRILLTITIVFALQISAQSTSLSLATEISSSYTIDFYKNSLPIIKPGVVIRLAVPLDQYGNLHSGLNFGYSKSGLKHKSNDISYELNINVWHISVPLYYRVSSLNKWHPRFGGNLNIPLKQTYIYSIYDGDQLVYQNIDKPIKNKNQLYDYLQFIAGVDVNIAKQWQLDFQTNFFLAAHLSVGIKYLFPHQTKK